jgi:hypothetical protein
MQNIHFKKTNKIKNMEYSECCGANRHHIWNELCADCLEWSEFETEEQ